MNSAKLVTGLLFLIFFVGSGCSLSLLPSSVKETESPWKAYEDVSRDFEKIIPYRSTVDDLKKLHFDPFSNPNISVLTYLDVMNRFMVNPTITKEDLAEGIRDCIDAQERCRAYELVVILVDRARYGNVLLDLLNFRRNTKESGWEFKALIVIRDNLVIYKLASGTPSSLSYEEKKNPLGPLQESEDIFLEFIRP